MCNGAVKDRRAKYGDFRKPVNEAGFAGSKTATEDFAKCRIPGGIKHTQKVSLFKCTLAAANKAKE